MSDKVKLTDPKPGTNTALNNGCKCPVLDNCHGRGRWGHGEKYGWFVSGSCPLHGSGKDAQ